MKDGILFKIYEDEKKHVWNTSLNLKFMGTLFGLKTK